jgi:hypothetical protein
MRMQWFRAFSTTTTTIAITFIISITTTTPTGAVGGIRSGRTLMDDVRVRSMDVGGDAAVDAG